VADRGRVDQVLFITHPEVQVDRTVPVPEWGLSDAGRERMRAFRPPGVTSLWSSAERKACEAAEILARGLESPVRIVVELGENDRSATGFLEPDVFEATADRFFAEPERSIDGWETAAAAQARIVAAVERVLADSPPGNVAIVSHGAVGTLLQCALRGVPITRELDQPGQGHWFAFERDSRRVLHGWRRLESHN
jgi:broad specificity phosphatase PhoE